MVASWSPRARALAPRAALVLSMMAVASLGPLAPVPAGAEEGPPQLDDAAAWRPGFREVTAEVGLGGWLHAGYLGPGNLDDDPPYFPEFNGPGACWLDYDGDGRLDLYLVNGLYLREPAKNQEKDPRSALFRNLGNGTFADVSAASGAGLVGMLQGCFPADYDDDGDQDLLVTGYGGNVLLRNGGQGTFANVTEAAGVRDADCGDFPCWGSSASWLDADLDGCLDLYVGHFSNWTIETQGHTNGPGPGQRNRFFRSLCDGTFEDRTDAAGLGREYHDSWSSVAVDLDNDGWTDLYVSNDGDLNDLYLNDGDGTFTLKEGSAARDPFSGMGTAVGDMDLDGRLDLVTTNYVDQHNGVYESTGGSDGDYANRGQEAPFDDAFPWSGWAAHFADLNNDGLPDLTVVNGMTEHLGVLPTPQPVLVYENVDGTSWRQVREAVGLDGEYTGRGGAWADYDDDGDVDFVLTEAGEAPTHLFRAEHAGGNFLNLQLVGDAAQGTRDAIGARVTVRAAGLRDQIQDRLAGVAFLGSSDPRLHFGLARAAEAEVEVRWPGGPAETWAGVPANAFVRITQGSAAVEVLRQLPRVSLEAPATVQRGEAAPFRAAASAPGGVAGIAWDLGDGATAQGPEVAHAFDDVGPFTVRVEATGASGLAKGTAARVLVTDALRAEVLPDKPVFLPTEAVAGQVVVRFSDGDPVRGAAVRVVVTYTSGDPAVDAAVLAMPFFMRELLGYVPRVLEGTTGADGAFAFTVPPSLVSPLGDVHFEGHHPGTYRAEATGGARGSGFAPASAGWQVGVPLPG